jgi:hypothetical protein
MFAFRNTSPFYWTDNKLTVKVYLNILRIWTITKVVKKHTFLHSKQWKELLIQLNHNVSNNNCNFLILYKFRIIIRFSFMTDKLVPIPARAMERRKNLNTEVRNLYNIRKLQLLLDTLWFIIIISILHMWTIYLWVPGNLKGLQIFTMNNIIK